MLYRVIGLMSGSSLDGLDIAYVHLLETRGKWNFEIMNASCTPYTDLWKQRLKEATTLNAKDYLYLHSDYGKFTGELINSFIADHQLSHQVHLIASHGHTTFHDPAKQMTAQLGDGAVIAAITGLPVVSDLRAMDIALKGQGAPIVPVGEKLLFEDCNMFLNLGGIANLSFHKPNNITSKEVIAFDVCPCNRVLNMLAEKKGLEFDNEGHIAAAGNTNNQLLDKLNLLAYYTLQPPKSLDNNFGTATVYPLLNEGGVSIEDCMRTYAEHIIQQVTYSIKNNLNNAQPGKILITGGGAFNTYLMNGLKEALKQINVTIDIPGEEVVQYKEALIMALIGVLRWREENNVLSSVTGATKNSIGGALWLGGQS